VAGPPWTARGRRPAVRVGSPGNLHGPPPSPLNNNKRTHNLRSLKRLYPSPPCTAASPVRPLAADPRRPGAGRQRFVPARSARRACALPCLDRAEAAGFRLALWYIHVVHLEETLLPEAIRGDLSPWSLPYHPFKYLGDSEPAISTGPWFAQAACPWRGSQSGPARRRKVLVNRQETGGRAPAASGKIACGGPCAQQTYYQPAKMERRKLMAGQREVWAQEISRGLSPGYPPGPPAPHPTWRLGARSGQVKRNLSEVPTSARRSIGYPVAADRGRALRCATTCWGLFSRLAGTGPVARVACHEKGPAFANTMPRCHGPWRQGHAPGGTALDLDAWRVPAF